MIASKVIIPEEDGTIDEKKKVAGRDILSCVVRFRVMDQEAEEGYAAETWKNRDRGGYPAAMRAAEAAFDCRTELAELYHLENPEQVAFTMNATHGLNIAIKSLVPPRKP